MSYMSKLWNRLRNKESRDAFVAAQLDVEIPFQIRALMLQRGLTQIELADRIGTQQSRISSILRPGKTRPNINTLLKLSSAFDCALMVKFVSFSELAEWSENFQPEDFNAVPFSEDSSPDAAIPTTESLAISPREASSGRLFIVSMTDSTSLETAVGFTGEAAMKRPVLSVPVRTMQSMEVSL